MTCFALSTADTGAANGEPNSDVTLAARGDRDAFERIYRAHAGRVYSLCARMAGDHTAAEELTQDVFVRAWEQLASFRGESAFTTWLHRLAVNVVLNARIADGRRRARVSGGADETMGEIAARAPVPAGDMLDLETAITRLPPGARRVFVLFDVEGYTHEEIAAHLGVTTGATKAQLHRARLLLREALNR